MMLGAFGYVLKGSGGWVQETLRHFACSHVDEFLVGI